MPYGTNERKASIDFSVNFMIWQWHEVYTFVGVCFSSLLTEACVYVPECSCCVHILLSVLSPEGYRVYSSIPSWLLWKQQKEAECCTVF